MIRYTHGDILAVEADALVNTVNCVGIMGRGIALAFKRAWPENFRAYAAACRQGEVKPGRMFVFETGRLTPPRFIINFPTKRHWRGRARMDDVEAGLDALVVEIRARGITSIAVPPLGAGLGRLRWQDVRSRIESSLGALADVEVIVFEPSADAARAVRKAPRPTMTPGRAALLGLMDRYLAGLLDPFISLLEVHKLMYFMQEAGEPLRLRLAKGPYGPYAENLRHVLQAIDGHYVSGYGTGGDAPDKPLELLPGAVEQARRRLAARPETQARFERVARLVDGFESPFGLELLATVHWVATREGAVSDEDVVERAYAWNERKRQFSEPQLRIARHALIDGDWLTSRTSDRHAGPTLDSSRGADPADRRQGTPMTTPPPSSSSSPTDSAAVRARLTDALRIDLIGPRPDDEAALQRERLPQAPSRWYLTGFIVPSDAPEEQCAQDDEETLDEAAEPVHGGDDAETPDRGSHKRVLLPSSMGLSVLVDSETRRLDVTVSWGDYTPEGEVDVDPGDVDPGDVRPEAPSRAMPVSAVAGAGTAAAVAPAAVAAGVGAPDGGAAVAEDAAAGAETSAGSGGGESSPGSRRSRRFAPWSREPRSSAVSIDLDAVSSGTPTSVPLPGSGGLVVVCLVRPTQVQTAAGSRDARAVSLFTVNRRPATADDRQDAAFAFQVGMRVKVDRPLIAHVDVQGQDSPDWDDRLADLHYRDAAGYVVGHNVSTRAEVDGGTCSMVHTEWMPQAAVPRVEPSPMDRVELGMEALGALDTAGVETGLGPLVEQYREWIETQRTEAQGFTGRRREVVDELLQRADAAAERIRAGVDLLQADPDALDAFRTANRAMAAAARRRGAREVGRSPDTVEAPAWRPFQVAYLLMNLRGIAEPEHADRETVDLLFFPTGGGKTEAYLGLAAFTLVLRRLRLPDPAHRGLSVLMRYTLRLLTLDQLGRAAALVCALELERERDTGRLGAWSFEIALWVGRAATPNHMGRKGEGGDRSARMKTLRYKGDTSREPPLPLEQCPWCGQRFGRQSFRLHPNPNEPTDLRVYCARRGCDFSLAHRRCLPIVAVDEPIYRRVPAFMIATADKFAALPWTGETARFFRGGDPAEPRPPDLIIQDELHLISGPLGSMAGLYETAIDRLCTRRTADGGRVRPKVIASTATVRLARKQIRALFDRQEVAVFPAPGIDRRDAFFAHEAAGGVGARLYVGVTAQGRGPKVVFLRALTTLMAAAQAAWQAAPSAAGNPADPYMTTVAYFNALRELGSARRIVEDEIGVRLLSYGDRGRLNEPRGRFSNRQTAFEPVELTSRVGTADVAEARRRLALDFTCEKERVDTALATNMISVGLDITRLGLMVVSGQPKTASEYIQATSRVGRDPARPGLVVTLLNVHKPRDRSHYERFPAFHESFYRHVEATSVTPFSARALDRALPAVTVALARLGVADLTPTPAARDIADHRSETDVIAAEVGVRAGRHAEDPPANLGEVVSDHVRSLIDDWTTLARESGEVGVGFGYTRGAAGVSTPLLREMIDPDREILNEQQLRFRAPRSLRDVEPTVLLGVKTPEGHDIPT